MMVEDHFTIRREVPQAYVVYPAQGEGADALSEYTRPLKWDEYEKIKTNLEYYLKIAESEIDLNEYFDSLTQEERRVKYEEHVKIHGQRYGGFGGVYLHVEFGEGKSKRKFFNAFKSQVSYANYREWVQKLASRSTYAEAIDHRSWLRTNWKEIDETVRKTTPKAELIFERFQPDRDLAVKVFLDRENEKIFMISWSKDPQVFIEMNGMRLEGQRKYSALEKGEWIQKPKDGELSLKLVSILSEIHITWGEDEVKPAIALYLVKASVIQPSRLKIRDFFPYLRSESTLIGL